jgi:tetratricopeptide (TPR) repeat protein
MRASSTLSQEVQMRGRLGPYEILAPIGSGGMGEVYRARDPRLDRIVAIKVLKKSTLNSANAVARFEREARAVAKLEHPHICPVYDVGSDGDVEFLVMQYLEGETLASRLRAGPLPIEDALKYASQIARAIDEAHSNGITHRDLKPSNVMITKGGAKLLDFGLAKVDGGADTTTEANRDSTLSVDITNPGTVLGTVRYMSPEALERRETDSRSDLFSLGAVLYEMIAGVRAFEADSDARAIAAILGSEPRRLRELRPETPVELESLIATCLAKNPDDRWQSARDVARQLDLIAGSRSTTRASSAIQRLVRTRPRWMAAAAVAATLIVAATSVAYMGWPASAVLEAPPHLVALPCEAEDAGERALCDGVTEALIGRLVRLTQSHGIQVTPQIGGFSRIAKTVDRAHLSLGATRVLQITPTDNRRWTLTMSGNRNEGVLATQELRRGDGGLFDIEERATAWLVRALALELTPAERETMMFRPTKSELARSWYLRGRGLFLNAREPKDIDASVAAFTASIENDSAYAAAHVGLGMAWRATYLRSRDAAAGAKANHACAEAVRLQPAFAPAHTCLGMLASADRQLERAASELARAIEADPTDDDAIVWLARTQEDLHLPTEAHRTYQRAINARPAYYNPRLWMANYHRRQAQYDDAIVSLQEVIDRVPTNARMRANIAMPLMYTGRYDEAIAAVRRAVELDPTPEALVTWGMTLFRMRRYDEAIEKLEQARSLSAPDFITLGSMARAYYWKGTPDSRAKAATLAGEAFVLIERELARPSGRLVKADLHIVFADLAVKLGRRDEAIAHLASVGLNADDPARPTDAHQLFFAALSYAQLGQHETALHWLERAVFWRVPRAELVAWPELDALRSNPEFQSLIRSR